jgi:hypothetical protein
MDTDDERAKKKRSTAASHPRKKKKTALERREELERDNWTKDVGPHSVRCNGCNKNIMLDKKRLYEGRNWDQHKEKCSQITGRITHRIALAPSTKEQLVRPRA